MEIRTGIGYDVHRLEPGRPLVLGGVPIESPFGLDGHSDADVVLHAIGDALLGAATLGDLGEHFPPHDTKWKNASSLELLGLIRALVEGRGYRITYVDTSVIAEVPRIAPHREAMRVNIGRALKLGIESVSVKATTNERLGALGRGEGIAALAVATVERQ
ncbi:MAG TPA: 2-C-methyl-D-erythritol 2,4-cyclodiphosphate synthase [Candidatus Sulfotelmatobacter sp.]|nr:2-C-methyl-D-erythritol 2,4-cyclodiphosphate synthase [Candidatus Sulfotelmatobacter sp.]